MSANRPALIRPAVVRRSDRPGEAFAEFRIGIGSMPWLADHRVQGIPILPGSLYVELARSIEHELCGRAPQLVRNLSFERPILLSSHDMAVRAAVREHADGHVEYLFDEGHIPESAQATSAAGPAVRLEIMPDAAMISTECLAIERFQAEAGAIVEAERLYAQLGANGNDYGPAFRRIESVWHAGSRALGKISVPPPRGSDGLHPSVLDSMVQLLIALAARNGKTSVLRSIGQIGLPEGDLPEALWAHAELRIDGERLLGDVQAFDDSGTRRLQVSGIELALLQRPQVVDSATATKLVVAANFTAEPVEDTLKFWGNHFGAPILADFAPYDQVFPQLLDSGSSFHRNRDGINVILLRLETWARRDRPEHLQLEPGRAARCFGSLAQQVLPNGLRVAHWKRHETEYLYREIFEDECYLRNGIRLAEDATVIDVGANIGLFSLFVMSRCRNPTILAFEPAPEIYEVLKANLAAYGANALPINAGVAERDGTARFTFYENSSVFSGFHADESADGDALRAIVASTLRGATALEGDSFDRQVAELTTGRLRSKAYECRLTSLSSVIREHQIERIDLLKVDAEKSELGVLLGIDDADWPRIHQIVVEVHDRNERTLQSLQDLLRRKGFQCRVERARLLEDSGFLNLYAIRHGAQAGRNADPPTAQHTGLQRNVEDFCAALEAFRQRSPIPLVLCVCPRTALGEREADMRRSLDTAEEQLLLAANTVPNVRVISSASLVERYSLKDPYDPHGDRLGDIPYSPAGYVAMGTAVCRAIRSFSGSPFKVIVLDCDNTLWRGTSAEDGPQGIVLDAPYLHLQRFMLEQQRAGMLLCLCSKNNEKDVLDVLEQRPDMVLRREHLAAWRISWDRKSSNLAALAAELNLGLESFIFIDDNPLDCADVRVHCPQVLTLQLPRDSHAVPAFLDHVWAFDRSARTEEDRNRTRLVREGSDRERFRRGAGSLRDFIEGLGLRVQIEDATPDQVARISQLTFRTNQFNFTTIRRKETEIQEFLAREDAACLVVRVADRFGDYGLVGVVLYTTTPDGYNVDTFLLSCRVLGRGVEHAVLSHLARRAAAQGKRCIELDYRPTERNAPARLFLDSIEGARQSSVPTSRIFFTERLAGLRYDPDAATTRTGDPAAGAETRVNAVARSTQAGVLARALEQIAENLRSAESVSTAMEEIAACGASKDVPESASMANGMDAALLKIWRRVLGRPRIDIHDNFFDAGGTSLKAVQILAMIRKELDRELSIVTMFECPTVATLAQKLAGHPAPSIRSETAASRGQRRRVALTREAA